MKDAGSESDGFEEFVEVCDPRLRVALTAVFGQEAGRDATADALLYGLENWERVSSMESPVGYLYRVGRSSQRRGRRHGWLPVPERSNPMVEQALPEAIRSLSEKQRIAVVLVHAYGWKTPSGAQHRKVDTRIS
jgi:DNA-directed RNA polymerase specialized sigma24 family protein